MPNKEEFNGFDDDIFSPEEFVEDEEIEDESEPNGNGEQVEQEDDNSQTEEETEEQAEVQEESETDEKAKAEAEKNAHYARLRRQREAEEKELKEKKEKEIREAAKLEAELGIIKKNPYTEEPIVDEEDLRIYKLQKAIEEKGGDPITDLPKAIAEENRKIAQERKAQAEQNQATQAQLAQQANELFEKYPEAIGTAQDDQELLDLMSEKSGRWTMTECYEYLQMTRKNTQATKTKAETEETKAKVVKETTNKISKTPSSQSNGGKASKDDYLAMTDEEYLKQEAENNTDFF